MTNATHFTAWMVNDPSALDQGCMDIAILEDKLLGGDPEDHDNWSCDGSKPQAFYAVTTVDAKEGDVADGRSEAEELMSAAGWRVVGDWITVPSAYIAPVEREA